MYERVTKILMVKHLIKILTDLFLVDTLKTFLCLRTRGTGLYD